MPPGPRDERDLHALLRRIYQLPHRLQLRLFETLHEYLELGVGVEPRVSAELRARREALANMERAAKHLALPDGVAPTGPEYDKAAAVLGLMARHEVIHSYRKWKNAQNALIGEWVPETPSQLALKRATSGRERATETYLHGIARWLDSSTLASTTRDDYDDYVDAYNDALTSDDIPLVKSAAVLLAFPLLTWVEVVAGARGELDPYELVRQRGIAAAARARRADGLIGAGVVAAILGVRPDEPRVLVRQGKLPSPIAMLAGAPVWLAEDILAHERGEPVPDRSDHELARELLSSAQLGQMLGRSSASIVAALHRKRTTVPPPDGRVSERHYWLKSRVEEWLQQRSRADSGSR